MNVAAETIGRSQAHARKFARGTGVYVSEVRKPVCHAGNVPSVASLDALRRAVSEFSVTGRAW
jgi:hypothetical protein